MDGTSSSRTHGTLIGPCHLGVLPPSGMWTLRWSQSPPVCAEMECSPSLVTCLGAQLVGRQCAVVLTSGLHTYFRSCMGP